MCSSGSPDKPTWATASAYKPFSPSLRTNAGEMCSSSNKRVNGGYRALFRFAIAFSVALVLHRIERPAGRIVSLVPFDAEGCLDDAEAAVTRRHDGVQLLCP